MSFLLSKLLSTVTLQKKLSRNYRLRLISLNFTKTRRLSIMHTCDVQNLMRLVFRKSILAVNPPDLVQREMILLNSKLHIRDKSYDLHDNCYIVGFGKCVVGMACKVEQILGSHLQKGIISIPHGFMASNRLDENKLPEESRIVIFEGAKNNLPDKNSETASKEMKKLLENLKETDVLIVLISGGGSSLLTLPKPPVTLDEKLEVIKFLGGAGANIIEMNTVRKRLSLVKGGGLASIADPCKTVALILSDVIGDPLDMIASGPTVVNHDEASAALKIIEKYNLQEKISLSVLETLKMNINIRENSNVHNVLIGNNRIALEAASRECTLFGFSPVIISDSISGLVSTVCDQYISLIVLLAKLLQRRISPGDLTNELNPLLDQLKVPKHTKETIHAYFSGCPIDSDKFCLIFGGEPTVKVVGSGSGGRNQELSLRLGEKIYQLEENSSELSQCDIVFLSGGTDGIDGPTSAAGAITYSGQIKQALEYGIDPLHFINRNDSNNFFLQYNKGKDLIITGHTGVNVMDIHILIVQKRVNSKL